MKKLQNSLRRFSALFALGLSALLSVAQNTKYGTGALFSNTTGFNNSAFGYQCLFNNTTGNYNTGNGYLSLYYNSTGSQNTAYGNFSLYHNTSGVQNTAIGASALEDNTTGTYNTAVGDHSLYSNSIGYNNTAIGQTAMFNNTSGENNTANGQAALYSNTTGFSNTAIGNAALFSNTIGFGNTALGRNALYFNTTGYSNTATGSFSLYTNTSGTGNTAIGFASLGSNTTGSSNTANGDNALYSNTSGGGNTAIGAASLTSNSTGKNNTANGFAALNSNTTGNSNTAAGYYALKSNITGIGNTGMGWSAISNNFSGSYNTAIGNNANVNSSSLSNSTALGRLSLITASNQVRIGNNSVTSIGGYVNWSNISDGRYKKNIKDNVPGLKFINALKPVTYNLKITELDGWLCRDMKKTNRDIQTSEQETVADKQVIAEKEKIIYTGFVAQDVEKAAKELGYDFSGVDAPKNDHDVYALRYAEFVVPLVKAVQELSAENDALKNELNDLRKIVTDLQSPFQQTSANQSASETQSSVKGVKDLAVIFPNPASSIVNISINGNFAKATIKIFDAFGKTVITKPVTQKLMQVDVSKLTVGSYFIRIDDFSGKQLYNDKFIKQN